MANSGQPTRIRARPSGGTGAQRRPEVHRRCRPHDRRHLWRDLDPGNTDTMVIVGPNGDPRARSISRRSSTPISSPASARPACSSISTIAARRSPASPTATSASSATSSRRLNAMANGEEAPTSSGLDDEQRCQSCGRRLDQHTRVCPMCLNKGKTFRRILMYGRPYPWADGHHDPGDGSLLAAALAPPYLSKILFDRVLVPTHHSSSIERWLAPFLGPINKLQAPLGTHVARDAAGYHG